MTPMRVTITIEDDGSRVTVGRSEADEVLAVSETLPAEPRPIDAGGPPGWLLQELEGTVAAEEGATAATGPMDAGPAPTDVGDGLASIRGARFPRGS
jgi:hypothetical protein